MPRFLSLLLAAVVPSTGCVASSADEAPACEPAGHASALRAENAIGWNGIVLNAITFNAISFNAITYNAISYNALGFNAIAFNGAPVRGTTLAGVSPTNARLADGSLATVRLEDGVLTATDASGAPLPGDALAGARLRATTELDEHFELAITAIDRDLETGLVHYELSVGDQTLCAPGEHGLFVEGIFTPAGEREPHLDSDGVRFELTYACTPGVIAKCVRWGYAPWTVGADMHQTCTRLARADYCGDGVSYTENRTLIDVFDVDGLLSPDPTAEPALAFEAGWGPDGAVCASQPRYRVFVGDDEQLPSCWQDLPRCDGWDAAIAEGALLGNRSLGTVRRVCDE